MAYPANKLVLMLGATALALGAIPAQAQLGGILSSGKRGAEGVHIEDGDLQGLRGGVPRR